MKFFIMLKSLAILAFFVLFTHNKAFATSSYGLSCTNDAYGTQHGGVYTDDAFVNGNNGVAMGYGIVNYAGLDCVYSGGGRTNSVAIVSGDIARSAGNTIVGAINSRIAMAMNMNADTAAHMSYSNDRNGLGMAANRLTGGLSVWTNYTNSDMENTQAFDSQNRGRDSNQYDGDSSSLTVGVDKMFGNVLVGLTGSTIEYDIDTVVNTGSYEADGNTYGVYIGLSTSAISVSAGMGVGDLDIDTTRLDLGTENANSLITGSTKADITYGHITASSMFNRGNFTIMPRLSYRTFEIDTEAFTDIVPNDANTLAADTLTTADEAVGAFSASSDVMELGVGIARGVGKLIPYLDIAYASEDTTSATYNTELKTDGYADQTASDPDNYFTIGAGVNLNLNSRISGNLSYVEIMDRDDYEESSLSATLKLSF